MWPYGQTPPLEKCEQPDLRHPQAMLQNDICPQNSPEGGRVSPPGPRTIESLEHTYTALLWTREQISSTGQSRSPTNLRNIGCFCAGLPRLPDRGYRFKMTV